jgi:malonyl-CoA decarboxylase
VRVDWNTPAALLEELVRHEAVHAVRGWEDLRRRLQDDRRCFAFFHPVLPNAPLIFVEVALLADMPASVAPLLDVAGPKSHSNAYRTAAFYGISNCEPGLRGVSLGNFLIKQVALQLADEFPGITQFCTLSPIPGFRRWIDHVASGNASFAQYSPKTRDAIHRLRSQAAAVGAAARTDPPATLADLELLCATYLTESGKSTGINSDPVARFHLNNGARLERINPQADLSPKGLAQSFGMMVNYVYDLRQIERNHESFVEGRVGMSRKIRRLVS